MVGIRLKTFWEDQRILLSEIVLELINNEIVVTCCGLFNIDNKLLYSVSDF